MSLSTITHENHTYICMHAWTWGRPSFVCVSALSLHSTCIYVTMMLHSQQRFCLISCKNFSLVYLFFLFISYTHVNVKSYSCVCKKKKKEKITNRKCNILFLSIAARTVKFESTHFEWNSNNTFLDTYSLAKEHKVDFFFCIHHHHQPDS